jgi:hypothetical protein
MRRYAPYPFILEALALLEPEMRPMFSGFAVYVGEKIVLMLRGSQLEDKVSPVKATAKQARDGVERFVRQRLKNSRDSVARIQFIERIRGFVKGSISVPKGAKSYFLGQSCSLFSVSCGLRGPFHGDNTGSNPVGDANKINNLDLYPVFSGPPRDHCLKQ